MILDFSFDVKGIIEMSTEIWINSVGYNMYIVSLLISWFWSLYCGFIRDFFVWGIYAHWSFEE